MTGQRKRKVDEATLFWAFVEEKAKAVEAWPSWKRVLFPEDSSEILPTANAGAPSRIVRKRKGMVSLTD